MCSKVRKKILDRYGIRRSITVDFMLPQAHYSVYCFPQTKNITGRHWIRSDTSVSTEKQPALQSIIFSLSCFLFSVLCICFFFQSFFLRRFLQVMSRLVENLAVRSSKCIDTKVFVVFLKKADCRVILSF